MSFTCFTKLKGVIKLCSSCILLATPFIVTFAWTGTLLGLLLVWVQDGRPRYPSMTSNGRIAFISDIAAESARSLFIGGCTITATFGAISFISTRWLRYQQRFITCSLSTRYKRKEFSCLVIVVMSVGIGGLALVLLSIFDIDQHKTLHWSFVAIFMSSYLIAMSLICWELRTFLNESQNNAMRLSYSVKSAVLILGLIIAVPYSVLVFLGRKADIAAVLEWIIAFLFIPYLLSMGIDVLYLKGYIYH